MVVWPTKVAISFSDELDLLHAAGEAMKTKCWGEGTYRLICDLAHALAERMSTPDAGEEKLEDAIWHPIKSAWRDRDIIILDAHKFVYRARWTKRPIEGWQVHGQRPSSFDDSDLLGWMPLPKLPGTREEKSTSAIQLLYLAYLAERNAFHEGIKIGATGEVDPELKGALKKMDDVLDTAKPFVFLSTGDAK